MSAKWRRGAPELTWGTLWVTCDNSPTFDGTGPQNAPEGTVDMNSIDNLRDYVLTAPSICSTTRAILVGYIDSIENEVDDMWHALTIDAKPMTDENMAESGWVRLPVDADGEPIHVGDVMEERSGHTFEVASIMVFGGSGNQLVFSDARNFSSFREPHDLRHHHVPTVEDVLREFAYGLGVPVADSYVAATAAKLRLKEG